jgi:hypothetical protein
MIINFLMKQQFKNIFYQKNHCSKLTNFLDILIIMKWMGPNQPMQNWNFGQLKQGK